MLRKRLLDLPSEIIREQIVSRLPPDYQVRLRRVCKRLDGENLPFVLHDPEVEDRMLDFDRGDFGAPLKQAVMDCIAFLSHKLWLQRPDIEYTVDDWSVWVGIKTLDGKVFQVSHNTQTGGVDIRGGWRVTEFNTPWDGELLQSISTELLYRKLRFSGVCINKMSFVVDGNVLEVLSDCKAQRVGAMMLKLLEWLPNGLSGRLTWNGMGDCDYHLEKVRHGDCTRYFFFHRDRHFTYKFMPIKRIAAFTFISLVLKVHVYDDMNGLPMDL